MEKMRPIRILLVDDHVMFREGLVSLLRMQPEFEVVGEAGTVQEAIALVNRQSPDVVLMDFGLPDGSGVDATKAILNDRPDTIVVILTVHDTDDRLLAAIRAGAKGYLLKNLPMAKLVAALRGLDRKEAAMSRGMMFRVLDAFSAEINFSQHAESGLASLSLRELEVLRLVAAGLPNKQIAAELNISLRTVEGHLNNIFGKLGVASRTEAILHGVQQHLISFEDSDQR